MDREKFTKEGKEILKDPKLFEKLSITEPNKKVVGEEETREVITLCVHGGRLVQNSQIASFNLCINDDAGTGKDYVTGATLNTLPKQYYIKKTRISQNVLNYWHNSEDEPQWTWDGKVLYLEDISESILNHDVFKVMCSGGSNATIIKDQKVIDLEVKGKPVMVITTATATPSPELVRRFVILNLDSSKSQTKEIMKRHSKFRKEGIVLEYDQKLIESLQLLNRVKVKIPFADLIDEHFPENNIIMRTNYPRFLDFISASTALHQFQREEKEGFFLAEGQDYNIARRCFIKLFSNKYMIPLTNNQRKILKIFGNNINLNATCPELTTKVDFMSEKSLRYNLNLLSTYGLLQTNSKLNSQNKEVQSFSLNDSYIPNEKLEIPTYEELCRITSERNLRNEPTLHTLPSLPKKNNDFSRGSEGKEGSEGYSWGLETAKLRELSKIQEEIEE